MSSNRLYRDEEYKKIGGVCAGLAEYFNVDVSLVRVLFVLAVVFGGTGVLGYVVLWIVVPSKPIVSPADEFFNSSQSQPEYQARPFTTVKKRNNKGRNLGGLILIIIGVYIMLEQYDIIPDIEFNIVWPIILIIIGLVLMFGFWTRHPQDQTTASWDKNNETTDNTSSTDNSQTL